MEIPVEGYASKLDEARFDRKDEECAAQTPFLAALGFAMRCPSLNACMGDGVTLNLERMRAALHVQRLDVEQLSCKWRSCI